jgi:NAD(P)-dependent dehydrogenase (short-subunit alcohol dehydrogenase family)
MEPFRYDGRRALVVGGATGMGAATAKLVQRLGGRVSVMDVADVPYPTDRTIRVDLRDRRSVDAAIGEITQPIDALFACAGVADGTPGLMSINFTSQRHIIETLLEKGLLGSGASVVMISSVAGLPWQQNLTNVTSFLETPDWDSAVDWIRAHAGTDSYSFSKQAINGYVAREAFPLLKRGIRINAVLPGPTDTPLARANADVWLGFGRDYRDAAGVEALSADQIAGPMAFLASDAASGITGTTLLVDLGHVSSGLTGSFPAPMIKAMLGIR